MHFSYFCPNCGHYYDESEIRYQCPTCSKENDGFHFPKGNLRVVYDKSDLKKEGEKEVLDINSFLPFPLMDPSIYPVGNTPLMRAEKIEKQLDLENVYLKLDSLLPSGSFKDRASIAVIGEALHFGEKKITLASTGNAGAAMSASGAAYGLEVVLFVPEKAPINKLLQSLIYNSHVVPVKGSYDDAFKLSIEYTKLKGGLNRNTAYNPITIEGKKTVSIELFNQFSRSVPDCIYVPVGDGCIISGVGKGFSDLKEAGLINKLPHIISCQAELSSAINKSFVDGNALSTTASTYADSISVDLPAAGLEAIYRIKESNGWTVTVSDDEIKEAQKELGMMGVLSEPSSATTLAALKKDLKNVKEKLGKDAKIVLLITGSGFKDIASFQSMGFKLPKSIENSKESLLTLPF